MSLVEKFNSDRYSISKIGDYGLLIRISDYPDVRRRYDFLGRIMTVSSESEAGGQSVVPFSQLDRESLEFFRDRLVALGGNPPELPGGIKEKPLMLTENWVAMGSENIAHVGVYPELQRKLTKIFNFESRQLQTISENLKTHAEAITEPTSFDALPPATVEKALDEFRKCGGIADENFVLRGITQLKKNKPSL